MHDDLAVILMIFGLVTFSKVILHPLSSARRSAIHQAITCLIFVPEVGKSRGNNLGKLGGGMWL